MNRVVKITLRILLIVIIPLIMAFLIGCYGYNRYKIQLPEYYVSSNEYKNTEQKIENYMRFYSDYYEELTDLENSILGTDGFVENENGDKLFSLKAYRWYFLNDDKSLGAFSYVFVLYNVHYGNVYYTINKDDPNAKFEGYLPVFELTITDFAGEGDEDDLVYKTLFAYNSQHIIEDYNFVGTSKNGEDTKKYETGATINSNTDTKWAMFTADKEYSKNVEIKITATDGKYAENEDEDLVKAYTIDAVKYNETSFLNDMNLYTEGKYNGVELTQAFGEDIKKAGYNKYVIGHYLWWEALIAFVLTLVVTGSVLIVWEGEITKENNKKEKVNKAN